MFLQGHDDVTTKRTLVQTSYQHVLSAVHIQASLHGQADRQDCKTTLVSSKSRDSLWHWQSERPLVNMVFYKNPSKNKVWRDNVTIHLYLFKWRFLCTGTWKPLSNNNRESKLPKWGSSITSDVRWIGEQCKHPHKRWPLPLWRASLTKLVFWVLTKDKMSMSHTVNAFRTLRVRDYRHVK